MTPAEIDELIEKATNKVANNFNQQLKKNNDTLLAKLDEHRHDLINLFTAKLKERDSKIEALEKRLTESQQQHEEYKEIMSKKCTLTVNGIPYKEGEIVTDIYTQLFTQLGYRDPPTSSVFRLKMENMEKSPIVIKLDSDLQVEQFMSRYFKVAKKLCLETFNGFAGDKTRIYISENLTTTQYGIFKQAMALLKSKDISKVRKKSGFVLIQVNNTSRFCSYNSIEELKADVTKSKDEQK